MRCALPLALLFVMGCPQGDGPSKENARTVAWSVELPEKVRRYATSEDVAFVATKKAVHGLAEGRVLWSTPTKLAPWLVAISDVVVTRSDDSRLVALDARTGQVRWRVGSKIVPEGDEPLTADEHDALGRFAYAAPQGVTTTKSGAGERLFAILEDGRILAVDPAACEARKKTCSVIVAKSPLVGLVTAVGLERTQDGWLVTDGSAIHSLNDEGELRFTWRSGRLLGGIEPLTDGRVAFSADTSLLVLNPEGCRSIQPLALSADTCKLCKEPPPTCLVWNKEVKGMSLNAPAQLDARILTTGHSGLVALDAGGEAFGTAGKDAVGPIITSGDQAWVLRAHPTDRSLDLLEVKLDKEGPTIASATPLSASTTGLMFSTDDLILAAADRAVLAGFGNRVTFLRL